MSITAEPVVEASTEPFSTDDERWTAVVARDSAADSKFYYSVKTTGVFCKPSCGARLPKRENVEFHLTVSNAVTAGFRQCKRCRPDEPSLAERQALVVARACDIIHSADMAPSLTELAVAMGMSRFHFQRVFKAVTGLTPKSYAAAHRTRRFQQNVRTSTTVTDAIYESGFGSNGTFYATSTSSLGLTPSELRNGGSGTEIRYAVGQCSLGSILTAATSRGVCAILLGDDPATLVKDLEHRFQDAELVGNDPDFATLMAAVISFVEEPSVGLNLPLDIRGTAFQHRVWHALRKIPVSSTVSYSEIAKSIGIPGASRAVSGACAANPVAVAVPCHRVVRKDGGLAGYRWGVDRKRSLLEREANP